MNLIRLIRNRKNILGLNERGLNYIYLFNKHKAFKIADNKLLTKICLNKANIPTPELISVIKDHAELEKFDWNTLPNSFVMKPVSGLEGGGIDIFYNRDQNGYWIRANKTRAHVNDLKQQAKDILDGKFSLNQLPDKVFFETRVRSHKTFKYYTYKGSPDVRIIVFNNIPIMSFLRLPTKESEGKANLALGAIALGVDMATGVTTSGLQGKSRAVTTIPGTKLHASGLKIPFWNKILTYAIQAQQVTRLNFAAIDFLIDNELGPLIVEMNARPGLSIQLANADGLGWRLRKAHGLKVQTVEKGIRLAKDLFGGEIEEEIETISGKEVIGIYEKVSLFPCDDHKEPIECLAKIDTGADSTSIDNGLAQRLGYGDILKAIEDQTIPEGLTLEEGVKLMHKLQEELSPKFERLHEISCIKSSHGISVRANIKITIKLQDYQFETNATIYDRSSLTYPVIVGRKSLQKFLVDPSKNKTAKS